jgi:hypothetical protein
MVKYLNCEELSILVNLAIASAKIKKLSTPYKEIRPNLHIIMWGASGSGKSTVMYDVAKKLGIKVYSGITSANLRGSIDKMTGLLSSPVIWECRNSLLMIDEYYVEKFGGSRHVLNELLSLMENPHYMKPFAYRCNDSEEKDDDLFCALKKNKLEVKSRFTLFINTMMNLPVKKQMPEMNALMGRCLVLAFTPSLDDIKRMLDGKSEYIYKEYYPKPEVKISKKNFEKIKLFLDGKNVPRDYYMRLCGDLCRVYAVLGKIDEKIFNLIVELVIG